MNDEAIQRAEAAIKRLHLRALELAHPKEDHDMGEILQALAIILEMQRDLAHEQARIAALLDRQ